MSSSETTLTDKTCSDKTLKKGPFSRHFKAEMWGSKKGILSVTDALRSATANETFP